MEVDVLDIKILTELEKDSRTRLKALAKKFRTSITTVNNRIKKLQENGIIEKFSTKLAYEKIGYDVKAVVGICIKKQHITEFEKELSKNPHVLCVYDVTGTFDSFIVARFKSIRELDRFLKNDLVKPHVTHTQTFIVLNTHKEDFAVF